MAAIDIRITHANAEAAASAMEGGGSSNQYLANILNRLDSTIERLNAQISGKSPGNTRGGGGNGASGGTFLGMEEDSIVVENNGVSTVIPKNKIALARLKIEF